MDKMEEHKILTGMLLVALVVSVVGTVITVDRLGSVNSASGLTGAVGGTGDLNITQDITISLQDSAIDMGNGKVDPSVGYAMVNSKTGVVSDGTWANTSDNITVRNDGNVGVNVTVQSNKQDGNHTTDSFICQSETGACGVGYEVDGEGTALQYAFVPSNKEVGACGPGTLASSTPLTKKDTDYKFCGCLKSASNEDEVDLSLIVGIPADAQGQKSSTITFTSIASDATC